MRGPGEPIAARDWEFLLRDTDALPPPPRVEPLPRLRAAVRTGSAVRILRRHGWPRAQRYVRDTRPVLPGARLASAAALRLAHRELVPCLTVLRLVEPEALCLARALAVTTYLSVLGLPAEIVVARQRSSIGGRFAFHAWPELYGEVLGDIPGVQLGFAVLQRVGSAHTARTGPG